MRPTRYAETCLVGVLGNPPAPGRWCHTETQARGQHPGSQGKPTFRFLMKLSELCKAGSPLSAVKANRYSPGPTEELPFVVSA